MQTLNDIHQQFASFFKSVNLQPFAYLVSSKLSDGHICLDLNQLASDWDNLPPAFRNIEPDPSKLNAEKQVAKAGEPKQPFILHGNKLYLQRYFNYESIILHRIRELITEEQPEIPSRIARLNTQSDLIRRLFHTDAESSDSGKVNWQLGAALTSVLSNFSIITGGPGTGKTTTVAKILALLFDQQPDLRVALAAPTGKAAARMADSLKNASRAIDPDLGTKFADIEPSTIHRLLGYISDSPYFRHHSKAPLKVDVLIVDESSMIDAALLAKLLDAVAPHARIILLGDKDQLASVEAGSLFGDLCEAQEVLNQFEPNRAEWMNSFAGESRLSQQNISEDTGHLLFQHVVELKYSHRFNSDEGIGKLSHAVIQSDLSAIQKFYSEASDSRITLDTGYSGEVFGNFVEAYRAYIQEPDISKALQKFNLLRILSAIREGEHGLYALNRKVEIYLAEKKWIHIGTEFYENRPVMVTSNNYSLGLFNGDIGIIRKDESGTLKVWFEDASGNLKSIPPGLISNAETVYAMTIHKSQGSEFNDVMVVLPEGTSSIMTRELLYTGITRAKSKVIISGSEATVLRAASQAVKRASGISERFRREE